MQMSRAIDRDRVHLVSVPAASAVEVPVSPVALFPALSRGKWQIAAAVLIALLIGGCYAYILATPLYRSTALLKLAHIRTRSSTFKAPPEGFPAMLLR